MKKSVYLETTIPSYLTAWRSPDLIMAANQEATREWWEVARGRFEVFSSAITAQEAAGGDPAAARRRLDALDSIPDLEVSSAAEALAQRLLTEAVPSAPRADALHIAVAAVHGMDFLLTWNCAHIANAAFRPKIEAVCRAAGFEPPVICTPPELMEET